MVYIKSGNIYIRTQLRRDIFALKYSVDPVLII